MSTMLPLQAMFDGPTNLPAHCTPTSEALVRFSSAFDTCVPTPLAFLSISLGIFSLISWLFAQLPQLYKNYQIQSASGLSIYFLAEWLLGDLTNLLGALFTRQATWQWVVAAYYVTVDLAMVIQYIWYSHVRPWRKGKRLAARTEDSPNYRGSGGTLIGSPPSDGSSETEQIYGRHSSEDNKPIRIPLETSDSSSSRNEANFSFSLNEKCGPKPSCQNTKRIPDSSTAFPSSKALLVVSMLCVVLTNASPLHMQDAASTTPKTSYEFAGQILSWCSTALYFGSRMPQIYKNWVRRSTSGLSPVLFIAAFFGNLFYSSSLLCNPLAWASYPPHGLHGWVDAQGSDRKTWITLAAPFFLGAAGVLAMDAVVGIQFLYFGDGEKIVRVEDRKGRSRWQRVNGWMRGWVPSPSPARRMEEVVEEERRPLVERNGSAGGGYGAA